LVQHYFIDVRRRVYVWVWGRHRWFPLLDVRAGLCPGPYELSPEDVVPLAVNHWTWPGSPDPETAAPGSVRHVEGVADVLVALTAVDAAEFARDFATEGVGVGV